MIVDKDELPEGREVLRGRQKVGHRPAMMGSESGCSEAQAEGGWTCRYPYSTSRCSPPR